MLLFLLEEEEEESEEEEQDKEKKLFFLSLSVLDFSGSSLVLGHALRLLEHKVAEPSHGGLLGGLDGGRVLQARVLLELVADGLAELVAVASLLLRLGRFFVVVEVLRSSEVGSFFFLFLEKELPFEGGEEHGGGGLDGVSQGASRVHLEDGEMSAGDESGGGRPAAAAFRQKKSKRTRAEVPPPPPPLQRRDFRIFLARVATAHPRCSDPRGRNLSHDNISSIAICTRASDQRQTPAASRHRIFDVFGGCSPPMLSCIGKTFSITFSSVHSPQNPYLRARHVVSQAQAVAEELGDGKSRGVPGHRLAGRGERGQTNVVCFFFFFFFFPSGGLFIILFSHPLLRPPPSSSVSSPFKEPISGESRVCAPTLPPSTSSHFLSQKNVFCYTLGKEKKRPTPTRPFSYLLPNSFFPLSLDSKPTNQPNITWAAPLPLHPHRSPPSA